VVSVVSVLRIAGQHFAFVVEGQGSGLRARQRPISVGEIVSAADASEGATPEAQTNQAGAARPDRPDRYEVRSGLKVGERIVVSGIQKLHDGSPLTIEPEGPAKGPAAADKTGSNGSK
jgi:hypothetical protein